VSNETHSEKGLRELVTALLSKGRFLHGYTYKGDDEEMHDSLFETDPEKLDEAEKLNEILRFEIPPLTRKEHEALEQALAATPEICPCYDCECLRQHRAAKAKEPK
jgi:hypothetical protein